LRPGGESWFNVRVLISQNFGRAAVAIAWCLLPAVSVAQTTPTRPPESPTGLSGYMDVNYTKRQFEDGVLDFQRFVLLVTHRFSDRLRFVGELELEHAFVEGLEPGGELELEQAYLDFLMTRAFNVRAGMMLVPVGIINERHEPPVFYGVHRPLVDTVIVPTTWFETGAGVHGEIGRGWRYRAYVMAPLNAAEFSADEGIRGGLQKGSRANAGRVAATGRVEYVGLRGLTAGVSFWRGNSGFEFRPRFDVPVRLVEADARYSRDRLELRGQYAQVDISNVTTLNQALALRVGVDPNVARTARGFYLEAGYRAVAAAAWGELGLFVRYENVDTQFRMADGYVPLTEFDRAGWTIGASIWPDPDVAIKFDYTVLRNRSVFPSPDTFAVGVGWWF
jgi:hypothetical protein